jgi:nucleoside-diphosphate-sugar epimerase
LPLALVTGASGFVGSHVVEALLDRDYRVRCLVREESNLGWLPLERVELTRGTMTDASSLASAARDVDLVVHNAGRVRAEGDALYEDVNVLGTRMLVQAVQNAAPGLRRFILMSSQAAGGPSRPDHLRTEDDPDQPQSAYGRSKKRGEEEVERLGEAVPWTILRPCAVYGPRDRGFLILARMAARGYSFRVGVRVQPVQAIHIRDLVHATLLSAESPRAVGRRYYIAHPDITDWNTVGRIMAGAIGKSALTLSVPRWAIPMVGRSTAVMSRLLRRSNALPADRLRDLLAPAWTCSVERARSDLGFEAATQLQEGMKETVSWYKGAGWL